MLQHSALMQAMEITAQLNVDIVLSTSLEKKEINFK